jgi:AcrR family transcriptional regulator
MPVGRAQILDGALQTLSGGGTLSLDSIARRVGLTKPGLMYHFPTKQALMLALVDHVVDRWDAQLRARLGCDPDDATPRDRMLAYLDWSLSGDFDRADLVALADPRLSEPLRERFAERMEPWLRRPARLPAAERTRLTAVRLLADGAWFADASGILPLTRAERRSTKALARTLLDGP